MRPRLKITEMFSTFAYFDNDVWVSRSLSKSRKILLKELTLWSPESEKSLEKVNVSPDPNQLKDRSDALEEWLRVRSWS